MIEFLTLDDVLESHREQIRVYGGSEGLRDLGLLESAIAQPPAGFGGVPLHRDLYEMAAAYLFHLVQNHPFIDGNKRVGHGGLTSARSLLPRLAATRSLRSGALWPHRPESHLDSERWTSVQRAGETLLISERRSVGERRSGPLESSL